MSKDTRSYWELLRDPRWQKKRLEIMQRDGFSCIWCGGDGNTLNVHHGYYAKGVMPWEYEDDSLHTLCEECHKLVEEVLLRIKRTVGCVDPSQLASIATFAECVQKRDNDEGVVLMTDFESIASAAAFFGIPAMTLLEEIPPGEETMCVENIKRLRDEWRAECATLREGNELVATEVNIGLD